MAEPARKLDLLTDLEGLGFYDLRFLGEGANGVVYRATQQGQDVTVKVLKEKHPPQSQEALDFQREVSAIACLRHPSIVEVYGADYVNDHFYLVTEFIEGKTLDKHLLGEAMPSERVVKIAMDLANALVTIHGKGFIHRDIKPGNVILTPEEEVKLIDFGLVSRTSDAKDPEAMAVGTLHYASPEQLQLIEQGMDGRSDLYSLGMLMYHCLSGKTAFGSNDVSEVLEHHLQTVLQPLCEVNPRIGRVLSSIVSKLIEKNPDDRYETAGQLLLDLQNLAYLEHLYKEKSELKIASSLGHVSPEPLAGRQEEVSLLFSKWSEARNGKGQLCFVTGESGFGKTRLCHEVMMKAQKEGSEVFAGKYEETNSHPLGAFRNIIHQHYTKVLNTGGEALENEQKILQKCVKGLPSSILDISPTLKQLVPEDTESKDSESDQEQYTEALGTFFIRFVQYRKAPCVLFVDDIQWSTAMGTAILQSFMNQIRSLPVLILVTARSEVEGTLEHAESLRQINANSFALVQLSGLSHKNVEEVVTLKLGDRKAPKEILSKIIDLAKGNPYMVDQLVRTMIDSHVITLRSKNWVVHQDRLSSMPLAGNLLELIQNRLAQIDSVTEKLIEAASICGVEFEKSLLREVLLWDDQKLNLALQEAMKFGLLEKPHPSSFRFMHDKVIEAVTDKMNDESVRQWHCAAVEAYKRLGSPDLYQLAKHYILGDFESHRDEARQLCFQAGEEAFKANSPDQALTFFEFAHAKAVQLEREKHEIADMEAWLGRTCRRLGKQEDSNSWYYRAIEKYDDPLVVTQLRTELVSNFLLVDLQFDQAWNELQISFKELGDPLHSSRPRLILNTLSLLVRVLFRMLRPRKETDPRQIEIMKIKASLCRLGGFYANFTNKKPRFINFSLRLAYLATQLGDSRESVYSISSFALIFGIINKPKLIEKVANASRAMATRIDDNIALARVGQDHAMGYHFCGQPVKSAKLTEKFRQESELWIMPEDFFRMINDFSLNLWMRGYSREVIELTSEGVKKASQLAIPTRQIVPYAFTSAAQSLRGQYQASLESRKMATQILSENPGYLRHPLAMPLYYFALLNAHLENETLGPEVEEIITEFNKLEIDPKIASFYQKPAFLAIAKIRLRQFTEDSSEEKEQALEQALSNLRKVADVAQWQAPLNWIMATRDRIKNNNKSARIYLMKAKELAEATDSQVVLYDAMVELARIEFAEKKDVEARSHVLFALNIAQMMNWSQRQQKIIDEFQISVQTGTSTNVDVTQAFSSNRYSDVLLKVSLAMANVSDPDEQAQIALTEAINLLRAVRGFFFVINSETGLPELKICRGVDGEIPEEERTFSETVIHRIHQSQEPVIMVADEKGEYSAVESIAVKGLKSIIAAPMFLRGEYVGIIYFDSDVIKGLFSQEDLAICHGLGNHIVVAQEMARAMRVESEKALFQKDLQLTAAVQSLFLPENMELVNKDLKLSGFYQAANICSGDWLWFMPTEKGLRVFLMDVTGHGPAPAMVTGVIATLVRQQLKDAEKPIEEIIYYANEVLCSVIQKKFWATVSVLEFDSDEGMLRWWNGAAPPIVLLSQDGEYEFLSECGRPMGADTERFNLGYLERKLEPGDRIHVFSDGLFEIPTAPGVNHNQSRLVRMMRKHNDLDYNRVTTTLKTKLSEMVYLPEKADDMTLVTVDYQRQPQMKLVDSEEN